MRFSVDIDGRAIGSAAQLDFAESFLELGFELARVGDEASRRVPRIVEKAVVSVERFDVASEGLALDADVVEVSRFRIARERFAKEQKRTLVLPLVGHAGAFQGERSRVGFGVGRLP